MSEANPRVADHPINQLYLDRWSPRAFTGESVPDAALHTLFEAARWAPSSYNSQPWRFLYAKRNTPRWDKFFGLLNEFNRSWAKDAGVLVVVASKILMEAPPGSGKFIPSHSHSFDAGAAWAYLALEAQRLGWAAHAMVGFDIPRAAAELNVPDDHRVEAAIAIGRRGDRSRLPEALAAREIPNSRNPQKDFVFEGGFPAA
ncbi:MAG: nitroreductase family protein [Beijerinckiaceae bacterium]